MRIVRKRIVVENTILEANVQPSFLPGDPDMVVCAMLREHLELTWAEARMIARAVNKERRNAIAKRRGRRP